MQRIDEKTYIDDSLVTCAEYQLFIDEMREQGKYYQPDYWTSYQFPAGQSREPVLGVRQSAARAWTEWLTRREDGEWIYRLPTQQEAKIFLMGPIKHPPLGYWVNEPHYFAWVGPIPEDPLKIRHSLGREFNDDLTLVHDRTFERELDRAHYFDLADYSDLDLDGADALRRARADANARALDDALAQADAVTDALSRAQTRALDSFYILNLDLVFTRARAIDLDLTFTRARPFDRARALDLDLERAHVIAIDRAIDERFDNAFDIFMELYTLMERIVGRSPAFEGIRLVKERIR